MNRKGFTIIEVTIALTLIGILSLFLGFFMVDFMKGYLQARSNSEVALKAQIALDRLSLEVKDIQTLTSVTDNSSITFTNPAGANRVIRYVFPRIYVTIDNVDRELMDGLLSFTLSATYDNMDGVVGPKEELAYVDVGFTVGGMNRPFTARVFPRTMVSQP